MREGQIFLFAKVLIWQAGVWLLSGMVLFFSAGTLVWSAGWAFLLLFFSTVFWLSPWLLKNNPGLLAERLTILKPDQPLWDKVFLIAFYALSLLWLAIMPLDAVKYHWYPPSGGVQGIGLLVFCCSLIGIFLTIKENRYLAPVIRIQSERGHAVISSGLYSTVRHPLYASTALFYLSVPAMLGSWIGMACAPLFICLLMYRSIKEECWLREKLPGYEAYMQRVRRRFIPGVW